MTPPPSHRRRRPAQAPAVNRRRRKRRARTRQQRSRRMLLLGLLLGLPVVLLLTLTVGATAVFGSSCDLNALRPVAVGAHGADHGEQGQPDAEGDQHADQPGDPGAEPVVADALDGVAGIGLAHYGEVLVAIHRRADTRSAAHAGPLYGSGPHGRIDGHAGHRGTAGAGRLTG